MRCKSLLCVGCFAFCAVCVAGGRGVRIAVDGTTEYSIVVDADASPTDRFAAGELQTYVGKATGAMLPIVGPDAGAVKAVEIGTKRAREIVGAGRCAALRAEESVYAVADGVVAIVGGGATGNAYGVYSFLERELGCKWLTPAGDEHVPLRATLEIAPCEHVEMPRLAYRDILCFGPRWKAASSDWLFLFRNRINQVQGNFENPVRADLAGKLVPRMRELSPACHSLFTYVPPNDTKDRKGYFKEHPEFYSLETNGVRRARQLCFANPELCRVLAENFLAHARKQGGKGFLDLSAQDSGDAFCHCAECRALVERHGSVGAPLFDFLRELAPRAKREFPELTIHFLVYRKDQTQKPPVGMEAWPDNLAAVFAPIDDDFAKPFSHPDNRGTFADFLAWSSLVRTWMWYYPVPYSSIVPFGGLERCAEDLRLAIEGGLDGGYFEHDVGVRQGINFADMTTWAIMRLYRDPGLDWRALRHEFCTAYYGAAAADMEAYEEDLERIRRVSPVFLYWHLPLSATVAPENLVRWNALFDRMERSVADDARLLQRVREARFGLGVETLRAYRRLAGFSADCALATPESIRDGLQMTLSRALGRRYDNPENQDAMRGQHASMPQSWIDAGYRMATTTPKPLPEPFASLSEEDVVQLLPERGRGLMEFVVRGDAAMGWALREKNVEEDAQKPPYPFGFHDWANARSLLRREIPAAEIEPGAFKFYRLGRTRIASSDCRLWIGRSWELTMPCSHLYKPGDATEWDMHVSLAFDGPAFGGVGQGGRSSVLFDRAIFVRVRR